MKKITYLLEDLKAIIEELIYYSEEDISYNQEEKIFDDIMEVLKAHEII